MLRKKSLHVFQIFLILPLYLKKSHVSSLTEKDKQRELEVSNLPDEEEAREPDRPPPLPPRKRSVDIKQKRHSAPPVPSWNQQQVYPTQGCTPRSPSERKRDSFQKKKYKQPPIPRRTRIPSSSSSCCSIEDYSDNRTICEDEMESRSVSRSPDPDHYNRDILLKSAELFAQPLHKPPKPMLKHTPSSISCPEMEHKNHLEALDKLASLDIMFKNRRSPPSPMDNRRMEFTIGSKPISHSVDSSPAVPQRRQKQVMRHRPHSFGLYGQNNTEHNLLTELRNALKQTRKSEAYKTKRKPLMVNDDPGSGSDLECIMENARFKQ